MSLLTVAGLRVTFGGLVAVDGVHLDVEPGEIHGIIGPNGAGKTTLLNVVTRLQRADAGAVTFDGVDVLTVPAYELAAMGLARTFQHVELFAGLSVLENVMLGTLARSGAGFGSALLGTPRARRDVADAAARAADLLRLVGLDAVGHREGAALPFAQQQLVGLARALAASPRLLLLDEPAASMTRAEVTALRALLERVRRESQVTIVLVEHVMELVMRVCDRVTVLNQGRTIAGGTPGVIRRDAAVIAAYLGDRTGHA